jgi:hypothetical protein
MYTSELIQATTRILKDSPTNAITLNASNLTGFLGTNPAALDTLRHPIRKMLMKNYLQRVGMAPCASLDALKLSARTSSLGLAPGLDCTMQFDQLTFHTCVDSMNSLLTYFKSYGASIEVSIHDGVALQLQDPVVEGEGNILGSCK